MTTIVAPVGDSMEDIFVTLKQFKVKEVILISPIEAIGLAEKTRDQIKKKKVPCSIKKITGNIWEEMFKAISEIKQETGEEDIIVNVSTGTKDTRCAATSAAFVNGIKALAVDGEEAMLLPTLKFSYYKLLTDRKMKLLEILSQPRCCASLDELSRKAKMSLPLVSYHIHGNLKSEGLEQLGLIETKTVKGRLKINLSMLGRLLLKGYVKSE